MIYLLERLFSRSFVLYGLVVAIWRSEYYRAKKSSPMNCVFTGFVTLQRGQIFSIITNALNVRFKSDALCKMGSF